MENNKKSYVDIAYNENILPFTTYPKKLVNFISKKYQIRKNHYLLELGCGRGEFLREFLNCGIKTKGLDQTDAALRLNPTEAVDVHDFEK